MSDKPAKQLHMVWPEFKLGSPPKVELPAGYSLRTFQPEDAPEYFKLMAAAGFENWNNETLEIWLAKVLPDGFFFVVHELTGKLTASAMATHNPSDLHPCGGELGWLAGSPEHTGKGLGMAVCAAVTTRFINAGYRKIYLKTDDWRLPALKTYLKLGYLPFLFTHDMEKRWQAVCEKLNWPFTPDDWPQRDGVWP